MAFWNGWFKNLTVSQNTNLDSYMKKIIALCAAALMTVAVYAADYPEITIPQLKTAIADKQVTVLDANGTDTYQKGHIPGAIDYTAQKASLASVLPKDKNALIVAYCGGPEVQRLSLGGQGSQEARLHQRQASHRRNLRLARCRRKDGELNREAFRKSRERLMRSRLLVFRRAQPNSRIARCEIPAIMGP